MKVSKEEVMHIAKLANLNLSEEEIEKYTANLQDILNFVGHYLNLENYNTDLKAG